MKQVGISEVGSSLDHLLDLVEAGEEVVITRDGRPVARMVQPAKSGDHGEGQSAAAAIRAMRKGVTLGGIAIRDLIAEGRS